MDKSCQESFGKLKSALCSGHVLAYPKPGETFILDTDASNSGIGGVLSQITDDQERMIALQQNIVES